nr:uncharacterized protein LOC9267360 isoform X3 [Oryza sativa Japonica Group]
MEPSRFVRICPRKRPHDGSSISSAANKHLELTGGVSCAIDEPSSSHGATGFSMLTGSSSCTIGSCGAGHIQSSRPNRDHFCPIVPARVARVNREKRQAARKMRLILRQEHVPRSLSMRFTYSIPKEHMQILKGFLSALIATYPDRSYYGGPDYECNHCGALFWYQERVVSQSSHRAKRIAYNLCCRGGKISLPAPKPFPPILQDLIRFDGGAHSNSFMRLIRQYNSLFAFTSLGANIDRSINTGPGPYVFISMVLSITELVLWFLLLDNVRNSPSCTYMTPPMSSRIGLIFLITLIILGMSLILLLCKSLSRCLISSILLCSSSVLLETSCFLQVLLRLLSSSLGQAILRVTVTAFPPPLSWQH